MSDDATPGQEPAPTTAGQAPAATPSTTDPAPQSTPPDTDTTNRRPPWERSGEPFDPARAWQLVERLRAERDTARGEPRPPTTPAAPPAPSVPVPASQDDVAALRAELARERVARRFGLDDDLVALLGDGDEDAITARAKTLADRLAAAPASTTPNSPVPRRPVEQLRGGADPTTDVEETDPDKLAALVRTRRGY